MPSGGSAAPISGALAESPGGAPRRERLFVCLFLLCACIPLMHNVHERYFILETARLLTPGSLDTPLLDPTHTPQYAPQAYRLGVAAVGHFLVVHGFRSAPWTAALIDGVCGFLAMYLLYRLLVQSRLLGAVPERLTAVVMLLALLQFPLMWVVPWQRPETLPTALYLAAALFCLQRSRRHTVWTLALFVLTAWQAFVRTDVVLVFGLSLAGLSMWKGLLDDFGSRLSNGLRGLGLMLLAFAVQVYLQFFLLPHLPYPPGTPRFIWRLNLEPHNFSVAVIALLPVFAIAWLILRQRPGLTSIEVLACTAAALYLPLWATFGLIDEIRIYVPFMMLLALVGARVGTTYLQIPFDRVPVRLPRNLAEPDGASLDL